MVKRVIKWFLTLAIIFANYGILLLLNAGVGITQKYQLEQPWSNELTIAGYQSIIEQLIESMLLISGVAMGLFPLSLLLIVIIHKMLR